MKSKFSSVESWLEILLFSVESKINVEFIIVSEIIIWHSGLSLYNSSLQE